MTMPRTPICVSPGALWSGRDEVSAPFSHGCDVAGRVCDGPLPSASPLHMRVDALHSVRVRQRIDNLLSIGIPQVSRGTGRVDPESVKPVLRGDRGPRSRKRLPSRAVVHGFGNASNLQTPWAKSLAKSGLGDPPDIGGPQPDHQYPRPAGHRATFGVIPTAGRRARTVARSPREPLRPGSSAADNPASLSLRGPGFRFPVQ